MLANDTYFFAIAVSFLGGSYGLDRWDSRSAPGALAPPVGGAPGCFRFSLPATSQDLSPSAGTSDVSRTRRMCRWRAR